jgi:hypothetical protein
MKQSAGRWQCGLRLFHMMSTRDENSDDRAIRGTWKVLNAVLKRDNRGGETASADGGQGAKRQRKIEYEAINRKLNEIRIGKYADFLTPAAFARNSQALIQMGFEKTREQNITSNVLLACDEIGSRRVRAYKDPDVRAFMSNFLATPGSETYQAFQRGAFVYMLYSFRKPTGAADTEG